jgi:hypothetical protein
MTYKEVREHVLKLLNQYTSAGTLVPEAYNNQADYLDRIPSFINAAVLEIATTVRKIPEQLDLDILPREDLGEHYRFQLPADFYQFKSGDTVVTEDGRVLHTNQYMMLGQRYLIMPKEEAEDCRVIYYRYPYLPEGKPDDAAVLDNVPETHYAVPFYVAALLVAHDDAFLCSLFMNKYTDKLQNMTPDITAEARATEDAYSFFM